MKFLMFLCISNITQYHGESRLMLLGRGTMVTIYVLKVTHKFKGIFVIFWEASVYLLWATHP